MSMTVIQQIKKERKKKRTKERKKNQIKLPGNEAYNFFFIDCFEQMAVYSVFWCCYV